jgi:methionyl-tRNA formyltransferase
MNLAFFGKGSRGVACLRRVLADGGRVVVAVGEPADAAFEAAARDAGLAYEAPASPNDAAFIERLRAARPEILVLAGYTKILRRATIDAAPRGGVNLHGGRLPHYRGASVLNWQIIRGEPTIAIHVVGVDEGIDTGPVYATAERRLGPDETFTDVSGWAAATFPGLLARVLGEIEAGTARPVAQPADGTYHAKRYPDDGRIVWREMTGLDVHNLVRALAPPAPGAFTFRGDERIAVRQTARLPENLRGVPGRVVGRAGDGVVVAAREGGVILVEIETAAGPAPAAKILRRGDLLG